MIQHEKAQVGALYSLLRAFQSKLVPFPLFYELFWHTLPRSPHETAEPYTGRSPSADGKALKFRVSFVPQPQGCWVPAPGLMEGLTLPLPKVSTGEVGSSGREAQAPPGSDAGAAGP